MVIMMMQNKFSFVQVF